MKSGTICTLSLLPLYHGYSSIPQNGKSPGKLKNKRKDYEHKTSLHTLVIDQRGGHEMRLRCYCLRDKTEVEMQDEQRKGFEKSKRKRN